MNIKKLTLLLSISLFISISCSSDDDGIGSGDDVKNYYPLVVENNWDFENTLSSPSQDDIISNEKLSVSNLLDDNGSDAYELETDNPEGSGPVTLALSQGILMKNASNLVYSGIFNLSLDQLPGVDLDLENVVIYDFSASSGTEIFSETGNLEQSFQNIPLEIVYSITSEMGDSFVNFDVNGVTYEDVINSKLVINLEVRTIPTSELPFPFTVLQSQDAVVINNYFANNVGLIQSETETTLTFEELPIPGFSMEDLEFNTLQLLVDYSVSLE